uniref:PDZ domain-containing protein n=1 Tax=Ditylenchus dipsaci TaxID=166011 RepID=A0A915E269_9BILA
MQSANHPLGNRALWKNTGGVTARYEPHQGLAQVSLNISRNDISDLPEDLKVCRQLLVLDVSSNPIARLPDYITHLPQDIGRLVGLKSLEVRENHLRSLPPSIVQLTQLLRLDLGQNELDELPAEIGALKLLQELYVDDNSLELAGKHSLLCNLEQLDVQSNRLMALPLEIGELSNLADLTLVPQLSFYFTQFNGRLKKLLMLRVDDNSLTQLTPAIGSCASLTELYLMQNLISELPSSIGNLSHLQNLNVDKNQITHVPALALWLSENQSQALLKLQQEVDARTGIKVLTCYLLPQQSAGQNEINHKVPNRSFVEPTTLSVNNNSRQFERHDTPQPKPNMGAPKLNKKQVIDGHVIPRLDENPTNHFGIEQKNEFPRQQQVIHTLKEQLQPYDQPPKSSNQIGFETLFNTCSMTKWRIQQSLSFEKGNSNYSNNNEEEDNGFECRLKRIKHSHMAKDTNSTSTTIGTSPSSSSQTSKSTCFSEVCLISSQQPPLNLTSLLPPASSIHFHPHLLRLQLHNRHQTSSGQTRAQSWFGLSIAGGVESTPYKDGDSGLFISKLIANAPAERAGLRVGDKVLEINGKSMTNQSMMRLYSVSRKSLTSQAAVSSSPLIQQQNPSTSTSTNALNEPIHCSSSNSLKNVISTSVRLDDTGMPFLHS